jgi:hypothetical protein
MEFKRRCGLTDQDEAEWTEGPDGVTLRFLRVTKTEVISGPAEAEAA